MFNFPEKYNSANIVKHKVYFKSLDNPSCIDFFITRRPQCFQNATVFSTGLSHFHKMVVTSLKAFFSKAPPKEMLHRGYKTFEQGKLKYELKSRIENKSFEFYSEFEKVLVDILNEHAALKRSS